jgi:hypothetical protein
LRLPLEQFLSTFLLTVIGIHDFDPRRLPSIGLIERPLRLRNDSFEVELASLLEDKARATASDRHRANVDFPTFGLAINRESPPRGSMFSTSQAVCSSGSFNNSRMPMNGILESVVLTSRSVEPEVSGFHSGYPAC